MRAGNGVRLTACAIAFGARGLRGLSASLPLWKDFGVNRNKLLIGLAVTIWFGVTAERFVDARQAGTQTPPATPAPAQPPPSISVAAQSAPLPPGYAGTDTCVTCHDPEGQSITHSKHGQAKNPRSPAATLGCESCHGPGQAHVDDDAKGKIKKFKELKPAEVSETCTTCHNRGTHAGWESSTHAARNLSCTTCHSVHTPQSAQSQLKKPTETQVCATCHRLQVTKTERAVAHMPVREGKMSCSSCHNPHGSISNVKNLKTGSSVAELCTSCHTEMRGPMLFEHAPVRENCATCHDPHGSSNDRMLVVRMPMLCQRCHIASRHPATLYDKDQITTNKSNRMFGRSCVNCHSNIHGSNHPSGQFYMR
jgi:DmsE family decaheme c-type cytochrome